ncbi:BTB/POZ domain-containing protein [Iris pallida]|uniref:BTB/POZ domain-containing protein n=1 Tax=Iris pallida TaxID=29817 RepID=A0AAX6HHG8_IRIPA|nr:BTB/POZ domain-containing protein [Iris pallida]
MANLASRSAFESKSTATMCNFRSCSVFLDLVGSRLVLEQELRDEGRQVQGGGPGVDAQGGRRPRGHRLVIIEKYQKENMGI